MRFRSQYRQDLEETLPGNEPSGPQRSRLAPWDQQEREPAHAWDLFQRYLISDARSIAAWARETGQKPAEVAGLASRWRWAARKAALSGYLHDAAIASAEDAARERGRQHGAFLADALAWAHESLQARN